MPQSPVPPPLSSPAALDVLVVGGGLCGLAVAISVALSGNRATVFEAFGTIHPFGSGLHVSPNGTRLLSRWGVDDILKPVITAPGTLQIHDFNGELLASRDNYDEQVLHRYQFPLWTLHRVDLQRGLTRRATDLGVEIHYSSRITDIDSSKPTITFENGEKRQGDLVVVADGTWSTLRRKVLGQEIIPQPAGYTAYRITVDRGQVRDSDLWDFMSSAQNRLNISSGSASTSAVIEELKKLAESWDPLLTAIFNAAQRVNKWQLVHVPPPPTMISPEATCVLAGDCCHSLPPFLAQGLNLGLEDAATLGHLLSHIALPNQLSKALVLYDRLRKDRVERLLDETCIQIDKLRELQEHSHGEPVESSSTVHDWVGSFEQEWIWSYDAYDETEKAYADEPF
ncbi:hypothetical protein INS49_010033 [Diaporthe citri]|uniref:uncharacterized protein n=1 Tax=Diaporthe citri TaxID=83186 RepID=UPI001C8175A2|nr:uncharacterized protein INS49_010033 [Diaporthe citri]KAG6361804.1 hypothetical protein INS49_010033 [Diaporthe citri]